MSPIDTTPTAADESDFIDDAPPVAVDALEGEQPAAPVEVEPEDSEDDEEAAAAAPAAAAVEAVVPPAPLTVKVNGRDVTVDGLVKQPDGALVVTKEQADAHLALIRDGLHHRTTFREQLASAKGEAQQLVHAARTEVAQAKADATKAQQLLEKYDALVAERIGSPEAIERFVSNYAYEMQLLQRDLQLVQRDVQAITPELPPEADPVADDDFVAGEVARYAGQLINEQFRDVFAESDYSSIAQYVQATARQYLKPADRDYPDLGVAKGEMVVDLPALSAYLRSLAAARTLTADATRAAEQNAASPGARTAPSGTARPHRPASAPPAMTSRAATSSAAPAPAGPPKTQREWEASLRSVTGSSVGDSDFDL
jgi:hypothetical protein